MGTKLVITIFVIVAAVVIASTVAIGSLTTVHQAFATKGEGANHKSDQGHIHESCTGAVHSSGGIVYCI